MELLLYRLELVDLVRRSGPERLLPRATAEVDWALEKARQDELLTAVETQALDLPSSDPAVPGEERPDRSPRFPAPWDAVLAQRCRQLDAALAGIDRIVGDGAGHTRDDPVLPRIETWLSRRTQVVDLIDLCVPRSAPGA